MEKCSASLAKRHYVFFLFIILLAKFVENIVFVYLMHEN